MKRPAEINKGEMKKEKVREEIEIETESYSATISFFKKATLDHLLNYVLG